MIRVVALAGLFVCCVVSAEPAPLQPPVGPLIPRGGSKVAEMRGAERFDFSGISVSQAVALMYAQIFKQPYVIDPAVLKDDRTVSFRFDAAKSDLRQFWRDFLGSMGIEVLVRSGVDYVAFRRVVEVKEQQPDREPFVYRTKHRSTTYLVEMLSPLFQHGGFSLNRSVRALPGAKVDIGSSSNAPVPAGSAASLVDQDSDTIIFLGTSKEIDTLQRLLSRLDVPSGEVLVRAVVYEVTAGRSDGTAFSLAANILGGRLGLALGTLTDAPNSLTVKVGNIDAVVAVLSGDSRFKAISTPRVRIKSGGHARLTVGQDVPTLGAVTVPQGGNQAVQSVDYRSSGVILGIEPTVREEGIDVVVDQQISDFVRTETGVNGSPTLTKRSLTTTVSVAEDELIVLGGLTQNRETEEVSGPRFLSSLLQSKHEVRTQSEVLLMMQVSRVNPKNF